MDLKFRALVKQYENEVYTLAVYLLQDRAEAEDVTQETYIKLWENLGQVEFMRAKSWLMKVTRNDCLDRLKRRGLQRNIVEHAMCDEQVLDPVDSLMRERRSNRLRTTIENLKEPYRSLIVLRDIQQHSYSEIAQTLELSLDQVKVYLYRARQCLKSSIQEMDI